MWSIRTSERGSIVVKRVDVVVLWKRILALFDLIVCGV